MAVSLLGVQDVHCLKLNQASLSKDTILRLCLTVAKKKKIFLCQSNENFCGNIPWLEYLMSENEAPSLKT